MTNNREEQIYKAADKATYQTPPQYSELVHKSRKVMCAYEIGFIDGCVWADSHPNWISVEDELPPRAEKSFTFSDYVLVCDNIGYIETACYNFEKNRWDWLNNVTHWMHLPQLPRKKE